MKSTFITLTILSGLCFWACKTANPAADQALSIPELLIRTHVIGPEDEMGYMLDRYKTYTAVLSENPENADALLGLAELFMTEARISGEHGHYYPAALKMIDHALALPLDDGEKYRALTDKASVLLSLHQFSGALEIGKMALALNPHSADIYGVLTDACVELGNLDEAVSYADQMVARRPDLRSYSRVAYLRELHGQVDGAIEALQLAADAGYPGHEQTEWVRLTLGNLYARYGMLDSAMTAYRMALMNRPHYPFAIAAMSQIHRLKGEHTMADSLNAVACHLIPEVGFFVDKAMWLKEEGDTKLADSLTTAILEMLADDEEAGHIMNLEKARVYMDLLNDPEQALTLAKQEWSNRQGSLEVNALIAEILIRMDRVDEARPYLTSALRTGSMEPAWRLMEGCIKIQTGMKDQGEQQILSILRAHPYMKNDFCSTNEMLP